MKITLACLCCITALPSCLFAGATNYSHRISIKVERPLSFWLSPHGEERVVLIIDGKRFEDVRGGPPYYLAVPNTNAVVFGTNEKSPKYTAVHFYSLDERKDVKIVMGSLGFGNAIGSPKKEERIYSFTGTNLCLSFDGIGYTGQVTQTRFNIDLVRQRLLSTEVFFFRADGSVRHYDIFPE